MVSTNINRLTRPVCTGFTTIVGAGALRCILSFSRWAAARADNDNPLLLLRLEVFVGGVEFAGRGDDRRESSIVLPGGGVVDEFWIKLCPGPVARLLKELVVRVGNVVRLDVVVFT